MIVSWLITVTLRCLEHKEKKLENKILSETLLWTFTVVVEWNSRKTNIDLLYKQISHLRRPQDQKLANVVIMRLFHHVGDGSHPFRGTLHNKA